jgi:hypothetical protein
MDFKTEDPAKKLMDKVNNHRGVGGEWPASFDYTIEPSRIILEANRNLNKSGYRCMDSWAMALLHEGKTKHQIATDEIRFIVNMNGSSPSPDFEAFKRRISYLAINNKDLRFHVTYDHAPVDLYSKDELFERPESEVIRDFLNERGDEDKGNFLEKDFQAFLYGKGLKPDSRTNDRMAILGEHFFQLKGKHYGILREFPTGAFKVRKSSKTRVTPSEFVDIVTLNRWGHLSVIELKLDDPKLEVMAQTLDYALFFGCYFKRLCDVIEDNSHLKPKRDKAWCYVVNNRFHKRFDDIFGYYKTKRDDFRFKIFKVVLGHTTPAIS